jgi:nucleotide-binding universal stress UspA family protein
MVGSRPVVVGVEDTEDQDIVVGYAAHQAAVRGTALRVVHAVEVWGPREAEAEGGSVAQQGVAVLERFEAVARAAFPSLAVEGVLIFGSPADALVERSSEASLVVLGHRGSNGFALLPLGSVSLQVASHAQCPVIVLPPGKAVELARNHVVVGVDIVDFSPEALEFAFAETHRRSARLEVVQVLQHRALLPGRAGMGLLEPEFQEMEASARRFLQEQIARLADRYPDVPVGLRIDWTRPATGLVNVSEEVGLLVVGSRGRTGVRRLLLGSVSSEVLHTARCPVAVVPGSRDGE